MIERDRQINIRMTEAEVAMLQAVADSLGLNQSDTVRQLVRKAYTEYGGPSTKRPKKEKRLL
jgi:hypothetical protein